MDAKRRKIQQQIIWGALLSIALGCCFIFSSVQAYNDGVITVHPKGSPAKIVEYRLDPERFNTRLALRSAGGAFMVAAGTFLLLLRRLVSPERYGSAITYIENTSHRGLSPPVPTWFAVLIIGALVSGLIYLLLSTQ